MILPVQKQIFAVVGNPVAHSLSPAMMNALFDRLQLEAVYLAFQVDAPAEDFSVLAAAGLSGLSVTLPHKEAALRLAFSVDETAEAIGAVNTLKRTPSGWEGRNTDWIGSNQALRQVTDLAGRRALVIGAGGAARAVAYGLKREGARVTIANRSLSRGEALAGALGCDFIPLAKLNQNPGPHDFGLVVQCTPVGLAGGNDSPILPGSFFRPGMVAMDTVYRPALTPFVRAAAAAGCTMVSGADMLLHQGVAQVEWWLDRTVPQEGIGVMRETLRKALNHG